MYFLCIHSALFAAHVIKCWNFRLVFFYNLRELARIKSDMGFPIQAYKNGMGGKSRSQVRCGGYTKLVTRLAEKVESTAV